MTFEQLESLLDIWKVRLGLDNWRIVMMLGNVTDKTCYMEVDHSTYYERAVIHVNPWFVGIGPIPEEVLMREAITDDFIESSLVHELLHLHTRNLRIIVTEDLADVLSLDTYRQVSVFMKRADEQTVDRIAEALVKAFKEVSHG